MSRGAVADDDGRAERPAGWWAPHALPILRPPLRDVLLTFADGRISGLREGVSREEALDLEGVEVLDRCTLAPGFVNAHSHIEYAAYEALVDALPFADWMGDHLHRKRRLQPQQVRDSALLGARQAAAGGITTLADASHSGDAAHAMAQVGLRGRVYLEVFGTSDEDQALERALERIAQLPESGTIGYGLSPHAPYTASERLYRLVADTGLPWMTHLLESGEELQLLRDGSGPLARQLELRQIRPPRWTDNPVDVLADVLGPQTVAVHLVHAQAQQLELLAEHSVAVVHCPRSNARLGCGVFDLDAFERAGVRLALGTDSPASAGPIDMFDELRAALHLHRAGSGDATRPRAQRLLELATVDAARALGYEDLGVLAVGALADVVACELPEPADPLVSYVLAGKPERVRATMVAGRVIWRSDRTSLDAAWEHAAQARQLLALPVPATRG